MKVKMTFEQLQRIAELECLHLPMMFRVGEVYIEKILELFKRKCPKK